MATKSLIDSVANTTSHRDRDDLDQAIAGLLLQFLDADQVTLYRLVEEGDTKRLRRAVSMGRSADDLGHPSIADLGHPSTSAPGQPPPIPGHPQSPAPDDVLLSDANPAWRVCITEQRPVEYHTPDGKSCAAFPITNDRAVIGMLEIQSAAGLQPRDAILVEGILRIMKNHLALLDYGESDTLTAGSMTFLVTQ